MIDDVGERGVCSMQPWEPGDWEGESLDGKCCALTCMMKAVWFCKRENTKRSQRKKRNRLGNFTNPTHRQRQRDEVEGERNTGKVQGGNECP
jgi:hypothetical protein